jgi:hypothetical protein
MSTGWRSERCHERSVGRSITSCHRGRNGNSRRLRPALGAPFIKGLSYHRWVVTECCHKRYYKDRWRHRSALAISIGVSRPTTRSLNKDAPVARSVQRAGVIRSRVIIGGLHHRITTIVRFSVHTEVGLSVAVLVRASFVRFADSFTDTGSVLRKAGAPPCHNWRAGIKVLARYRCWHLRNLNIAERQ